MYKKNHSFRNKIIVCLVIICCLILSSVFINRNFNLPDFFLKDGILFVDKFISKPFQKFSDKEYQKLVDENEDLKIQLEKIKYYENENAELNAELSKLKDTLKINKLLSDKTLINASVSSRGLDYWTEKLIIDKGSNDGITNNMAVVSDGYLIGITDDVGHFNSHVSLLSNSKFPMNISVKIRLDDKEVYGILNNYNQSTGLYEVMGIVENVDIPKGSSVVTTGLGNIFPSGILVGTVDSISTDNFDLSKIVTVKTDVDFNNISYVTIVKRDDK